MIFLILAIFSSTAMNFVMKFSENRNGNRYVVATFNYLTGTVVSYLLLTDKDVFLPMKSGGYTLWMGILNAFLMVVCLLLIQSSIQKNGMSMTTIFNRMGILIPTVLSAVLFHEIPTWLQIIGLLLAVLAIIYINGGAEKEKGNMALLFVIFFLGGSVDMMSKLFSYYGQSDLKNHFVLYTFAISFVFSLVLLLIKNRDVKRRDVTAGILVGIPNQLVVFATLKAASMLPAYMVYPVYSASVILAANLVDLLIFKEKLTKRQYIGTGIIAAALVLINL